jgi:hypothetical protein
MHKIVRRCNLEEGRIRKDVIFVSATAAAATHEVVITVRSIEKNLTVQNLISLQPPKYRLILTKIPKLKLIIQNMIPLQHIPSF